jgi:putative DNA-invertase from lambdoid prophage Rac
MSKIGDPPQITAAIYVRVSTVDQNDDLQFQELREYAGRMKWRVVEYVEKVSSVKKRPELNRMMDDARHRKFDVVIVWKLDRFARSLRQLIDNIQLLDSYGVRFIAATQGIDTDKNNPASRLMLHILGAVAEFERGLITERVRAGVKEAQRRGKHCGRPKRIYRRDHLVKLRASGLSLRAIAAQTGLPLTTVADALRVK